MSIIDYAQKYGDQTFDEMPFNEIDNLVLCNILYCDYQKAFENLNHPEKISLGMLLFTAIEKLDLRKENRGLFLGNKPLRLAKKIYNSKRYKNILASDYREITNQTNNTQFAAICYHIADNLIFLCFRGTDDSVSGWMENLDLLIEEKMPSQNYARDYLNEMMDKYHDYSFILGGHSKGGNLCIYAATYGKIENQDRILKIFSNDGTGFYPHVFDYSRFEKLKKRSLLIAPAHCLVGNILEQPVKNRLIIATKKNGLFSHDLNNWVVEDNHLVKCDSFSNRSQKVTKEMNALVYQYPLVTRQQVVGDFNACVKAVQVQNLYDFKKNSTLALLIYMKLSLHSKQFLLRIIRILVINNFLLN